MLRPHVSFRKKYSRKWWILNYSANWKQNKLTHNISPTAVRNSDLWRHSVLFTNTEKNIFRRKGHHEMEILLQSANYWLKVQNIHMTIYFYPEYEPGCVQSGGISRLRITVLVVFWRKYVIPYTKVSTLPTTSPNPPERTHSHTTIANNHPCL